MKHSEAEAKFPKGSRVRLNIGGPDMVVKDVDYGMIICQWFVGKKLEQGKFAPESIILVKEMPEAPKP